MKQENHFFLIVKYKKRIKGIKEKYINLNCAIKFLKSNARFEFLSSPILIGYKIYWIIKSLIDILLIIKVKEKINNEKIDPNNRYMIEFSFTYGT